jgi:hypothetical protein
LCLTKRNGAPVHVIAWVLEHVSVDGIVTAIHAITLHSFLCGNLTLKVRVGKRVLVEMSKAEPLDRTH